MLIKYGTVSSITVAPARAPIPTSIFLVTSSIEPTPEKTTRAESGTAPTTFIGDWRLVLGRGERDGEGQEREGELAWKDDAAYDRGNGRKEQKEFCTFRNKVGRKQDYARVDCDEEDDLNDAESICWSVREGRDAWRGNYAVGRELVHIGKLLDGREQTGNGGHASFFKIKDGCFRVT